ncbi:MAG TPA: hypothetical protein VKM93_13810 [Terriglobia bacterium]|nr:hypothetical protein [Terriglobia bacterium]
MKAPTRLQPRGRASQPKAAEPNFSRFQSPAGNWGGPQEVRGLLITLYTLVV